MQETWRPIQGYEGWYEVSNLGRVRRTRAGKSTHAGRILNAQPGSTRRLQVALTKDGKGRTVEVGSLVATAFLGPRPAGKEINHIDYDPTNNRVDNLEYITRSENIKHAYDHGFVGGRGERQHLAKLIEADVRRIRSSPLGCTALAAHYGVSRAAIKHVRARRTWKHV